MLGAISSIVHKIQGKSQGLDSSAESAKKVDLSPPEKEVAIEAGAESDDVLKKNSSNAQGYQKLPHKEAEKEPQEVINEALAETIQVLEFQSLAPKQKPKNKKKQEEESTLIDGESATKMDRIFRKTNEVIEKLKGSNSYKSGSPKIKTNPKGNLIDRKTG